jgi:predicted RNA binding protein YcfA (HicA-like mRNA interferase family)
MKFRDMIKLLKEDGWYLVRSKGSHQQYRHPEKPGLVTVAGRGSDDIGRRTLKSILKQAGLDSPPSTRS